MKKISFVFLSILSLLQSKAQDVDTVTVRQPNRWIKPVAAMGYAGATYLTYKYLDHIAQDESQEGKTQSKKMIADVVNPLGVGKFNTMAIGGLGLLSVISKNKKLQQTAIIWAGSAAINSMLVQQLKVTFQRHRPNTGDPYNTFDWRRGPRINKSFPSAHTANAFTAATVFATLYSDTKWVPAVAYSIATLTGLSRIYNNAHWASDVMAGAAVGFLSAKAMVEVYKKVNQKFMILPGMGRNAAFVSVICKL